MSLTLLPIILAQWVHVILGIFWFGSVLYRNIVVLPVILSVGTEEQRLFGKRIKEQADQFIIPASLLVIGMGILRGTIWGGITSADALFNTDYGLTWLTALVFALITFAWDVFFVGAEIENWYLDPEDAQGVVLTGSAATLAIANGAKRIRTMAWIEFGGFLVIFSCMILMRFGY